MASVGRDTNKQLFHHQDWSALFFPKKNFGKYRKTLRLLTHVRLVLQNVLILSEVSLYMERSKNLEKKMSSPCKKKFTFLRGFDCENKVFGISRNLIDRFVFK